MSESKEELNRRKREWRNANPEKILAIRRRYLYGIEPCEIQAILNAQDGKCKICGSDGGGKKLSLDHNHSTGQNRGMLCGKCNMGIGLFKEDKELLINAIRYLALWETVQNKK